MAGLNLFTNNASTTLASGITSGDTSLTVSSGTGALFPTLAGSQYFYTTLSNIAGTIIEIVKVTARAGDTFTIVRAQDNTAASAYITGDKVELRLVNASLGNFPQLDSTNTFSQTQTFVTPILGTPTSGTLTNCTGYTTANLSGSIGLTTQVTGTLPIANGGTGTTSTTFTNLTTNVTGTLPIANGGTGSTSTTFVNAATNITGTLPVANGGTGASTLTANNVILGNGTSAVAFVAPGTNGNILTSNGTTWTSAAAPAGGVTSLNGQTGAVVNTTQYSIGSYIAGRPQNGTNYTGDNTIAGTSLYATFLVSRYQNPNSEGQGWQNPNTGSPTVQLVNTGSWRCVSPAFGDGASQGAQGWSGLWVRYA